MKNCKSVKSIAKKALKNKGKSRMSFYEILANENEFLQLELEEKNLLINQMKIELKLKKKSTILKENVILQKEVEIKKRDLIIDQYKLEVEQKNVELRELELIIHQNHELLQKNVQQKSEIEEMNLVLDQKELVIISKEDLIGEKLEIIKSDDLKILQLNKLVSELSESIRKLEQINKEHKIRSKKLEGRLQEFEFKMSELYYYIECLHMTLERQGIFDSSADDLLNDSIANGRIISRHDSLANENKENSYPNGSSDRDDVPINQITNQLLKMMDEDSPNEQFLQSCIKKTSNKTISRPKKKSIRFSCDVHLD